MLQVLGPSTGGIRRHVGELAQRLMARGWRVEVAGPPDVMAGAGPQHHDVDVPDTMSPATAWRARTQLAALIREADVVHAHGLKAGWVAASIRNRPPLVVTLHNVVLAEVAGGRAPLLARMERALPARVDAVIAVSGEIARRFTGARGADRITVVPPVGPTVSPRRTPEEVRAALGLAPHERLVVAAASRLHPQKDVATLVRAAATLRDTHADVRVVVVGEGAERPALEHLIASLQLDGYVRLIGMSPNAADELAAADLVVQSSIWEGSPLMVAEALQLGRPVVATAVGAIPDVVVNGETGRLVPPGDPRRLAAAMAELLDDPDEARALGDAGRRRVQEMLDPDRLLAAVESVYRARGRR